jgi:hypothetical protein
MDIVTGTFPIKGLPVAACYMYWYEGYGELLATFARWLCTEANFLPSFSKNLNVNKGTEIVRTTVWWRFT